jgi:ATP-binding cassette subfamily F protein 3
VLDAMRAAGARDDQEARNLLARFLFRGDDVTKSVAVLSGGERSRLALARLSLRHANLLVLDEPTNHLDLAAREQLEAVLIDYEGTLVFVSHDRYFIDKLASELWLISGGLLRRFEGGWTAYQRERAAGRDAPVVEYLARESGAGAAPRAQARPPARRDGVSREQRVSAPRRGQDEANTPSPDRTRPTLRRGAKAWVVRRVSGTRALEVRIEAMELQLKQLTEKVSQIAQSGNYLETRRIGEEHAALERSLKDLYEEWAKVSEAPKE